ncbi:unnamed protein product [Euphydryas editha]|nr:unnamed protein product [Euphydryas editha]
MEENQDRGQFLIQHALQEKKNERSEFTSRQSKSGGKRAQHRVNAKKKMSNSLRQAELFQGSLPSLSKLLRDKVGFR